MRRLIGAVVFLAALALAGSTAMPAATAAPAHAVLVQHAQATPAAPAVTCGNYGPIWNDGDGSFIWYDSANGWFYSSQTHYTNFCYQSNGEFVQYGTNRCLSWNASWSGMQGQTCTGGTWQEFYAYYQYGDATCYKYALQSLWNGQYMYERAVGYTPGLSGSKFAWCIP